MKHTATWGKSTAINLYGCNKKTLANPDAIKEFIAKVIKKINMVAHGPTHIERFGSGDLEGYSAMQFIETSSITIHCDEVGGRAFIDIFSCRDFDPSVAKESAESFFEANISSSVTIDR
jgi:S-adenosylmethionine/arginine decarboxylase-like enzyme